MYIVRSNWRDDAKCANDPNIQQFLKERVDVFHDAPDAGWVKEYCFAGCPVRRECLEVALALHQLDDPHTTPQGIWGGLNQKERALLLQKRKKQQAKILQLSEQMKALSQGKSFPNAS